VTREKHPVCSSVISTKLYGAFPRTMHAKSLQTSATKVAQAIASQKDPKAISPEKPSVTPHTMYAGTPARGRVSAGERGLRLGRFFHFHPR